MSDDPDKKFIDCLDGVLAIQAATRRTDVKAETRCPQGRQAMTPSAPAARCKTCGNAARELHGIPCIDSFHAPAPRCPLCNESDRTYQGCDGSFHVPDTPPTGRLTDEEIDALRIVADAEWVSGEPVSSLRRRDHVLARAAEAEVERRRDRQWSNRIESQDTLRPDSPDVELALAWYMKGVKP